MQRRFTQVDVFGPEADGFGNPLGVVVDADGLSDAEMAGFAAWTNLSETVFLLPPTTPEADYRVRIFTIDNELPFAGHPTLGSGFAWLAAGGVPRRAGELVQECGVGLVPLLIEDDQVAFAAPPRRRTGPLSDELVARIESVIGVPSTEWVAHEWGDNGPPWMMVELADAQAVRTVRFDHSKLGPLEHLGLVGRETGRFAYEVRGQVGAWEDPVTGQPERFGRPVAARPRRRAVRLHGHPGLAAGPARRSLRPRRRHRPLDRRTGPSGHHRHRRPLAGPKWGTVPAPSTLVSATRWNRPR